MRIQLLSPIVINQIAAGEVIERPASVIKELVENSIDAGAKTISIEVNNGGRRLIRIRDDGAGIHNQDLALAIAAHATSKIDQLADLQTVATLGFRGEALASIAAISRFQLTSKTATQEVAWSIAAEGSQPPFDMQPAAHPLGTTVEVRDLFFNTPVRRKFLRSESVEMAYIELLLKRLVLSRFDIQFNFRVEEKLLWQLNGAQNATLREKRIAKMLGSPFLAQAISIEKRATEYTLSGWLGLPSYHRSQTDSQYLYINGRMIRDKLLTHAIRMAYEGLIPTGRHPAYVLYLELAADAFDVNVHPGKQEVRFHEPRMVHNFMLSAIKQALGPSSAISGSISPEKTDNAPPFYRLNQPNLARRGLLAVAEQQVSYGSAAHPAMDLLSQAAGESLQIIVLNERYLMASSVVGWLLCDGYAMLQHHHALRLLKELAQQGIAARPLAVPFSMRLEATIALSKVSLSDLLQHYRQQLQSLGLLFDELAPNTLAVRQLPLGIHYNDPKQWIEKLIQLLLTHYPQPLSSNEQQTTILLLTEPPATLKLVVEEIEPIVAEIVQSTINFSTTLQQPLFVVLKNSLLATLFTQIEPSER